MIKILSLMLLSSSLWAQFDYVVSIKMAKRGMRSICTGTLIRPNVVLTAAHCLEDVRSIKIFTGEDANHPDEVIWARDWSTHPDYKGNQIDESTDVGLIFLDEAVSYVRYFPKLNFYNFSKPVIRVGLGTRNEQNIKTVIKPTLSYTLKTYVVMNDLDGVSGDSGGPLIQKVDQKEVVVGIHTGRKKDKEGELLNFSFVQLLAYTSILGWIESEIGFFNLNKDL